MLDKNPEQFLDNVCKVFDEFSKNNPNIVLSSEPFLKSQFLVELMDLKEISIIFLDFDLLYSGYVLSEMIKKNNNVQIYRPDKSNLNDIFSNVVKTISEKKHLIILDSFNGFYNLLPKIESGIFINAITMLLSSVAKQTDSVIVITGMAKKRENEGWVLLPGGRHILESKNSGLYFIKSDEKTHFKIMKLS